MSDDDPADGAGDVAPDIERSAELVGRAVRRLIDEMRHATPNELPAVLTRAAAVLGATEPIVYLADLQQRNLVPFRPGEVVHEESPRVLGIESTVAGRAFQHSEVLRGSPVVRADAGTEPLWLPLLNGSERLGVLGIVLDSWWLAEDARLDALKSFAAVVAELVVTKALYGDSIVTARRTSEMTLAAEVQWSLLPPLTFASRAVTIAGGLEPAYEVAGDSLDYAVDTGVTRFGVFDGMGHGIVSAQLISLVVAAYRNARRSGRSLAATAAHIEAAVGHVFGPETFTTGVVCELDNVTGQLRWISAGHHEPLLIREGRLVRSLTVEPLLPFGLNQDLGGALPAAVGSEQLQPGDVLLLHTDGVTDARSPTGEYFGQDRLIDSMSRALAADLPAAETMRRLVHLLLDHRDGHLDDDATLLMVRWHGASGAEDVPGAGESRSAAV